MKQALSIVVLGTLGCAAPGAVPTQAEPASAEETNVVRRPINATCPRSGKPVAGDSLTEYRGYSVGFCNTHCRDDFAANVDERPNDTNAFDAVIAELQRDWR